MTNGYYSFDMNGKQIGLKFGLPANRLMWEEMIKNPEIIDGENINELGIVHLILAGHKNNCLLSKTQPVLEFADVLAWVEEAYIDEGKKQILDQIGAAYSESQITVKFIEEKQKWITELKKKIAEQTLTSTTSNLSATES